MQRINVNVPVDLWRLVGIRAAEDGLEKRQVLTAALEAYLRPQNPAAAINVLRARRRDRGALTAREQEELGGTFEWR